MLLCQLQKQHALLRGFGDWEEVVAFMREGTSRDPSKNAVLLPIFVAHASDRDPRWRTILFVVFWPALESIHRRKRYWDSDPDALWSNIEWSFLRTVCRLDPSRRRERFVQKVFNDLVHLLHDEYRRAWDQAQQQQATDPEELAEHAEDSWDAAADLRDEQAVRIKHLQTHRDAGRLSDADFLLLVGTHVYGQSLADYARQAGLTYEAAKKRHQRAMRAIGGFPRYEA